MCLLGQSQNVDLCITIEVSILVIGIVSALFLYQVVWVWLRYYKYRCCSDRRIWVLFAGFVYTGGK